MNYKEILVSIFATFTVTIHISVGTLLIFLGMNIGYFLLILGIMIMYLAFYSIIMDMERYKEDE